MGGRAAGMDDALGNTLVIEMRDFLAHQDVFEQRRTANVRFERILVVADDDALIGRQVGARCLRTDAKVDVLVGILARGGRLVGRCQLTGSADGARREHGLGRLFHAGLRKGSMFGFCRRRDGGLGARRLARLRSRFRHSFCLHAVSRARGLNGRTSFRVALKKKIDWGSHR